MTAQAKTAEGGMNLLYQRNIRRVQCVNREKQFTGGEKSSQILVLLFS